MLVKYKQKVLNSQKRFNNRLKSFFCNLWISIRFEKPDEDKNIQNYEKPRLHKMVVKIWLIL